MNSLLILQQSSFSGWKGAAENKFYSFFLNRVKNGSTKQLVWIATDVPTFFYNDEAMQENVQAKYTAQWPNSLLSLITSVACSEVDVRGNIDIASFVYRTKQYRYFHAM